MTENEAIKGLKNLFSEHELDLPCTDSLEVLHMAIQALEEVQQYRAIGTVEEIKKYFNENRKAGYKHGYSDGYVKAIDSFVKEIETEYDNDACPNVTDYLDYKISLRDLFRIAEQMKAN